MYVVWGCETGTNGDDSQTNTKVSTTLYEIYGGLRAKYKCAKMQLSCHARYCSQQWR